MVETVVAFVETVVVIVVETVVAIVVETEVAIKVETEVTIVVETEAATTPPLPPAFSCFSMAATALSSRTAALRSVIFR